MATAPILCSAWDQTHSLCSTRDQTQGLLHAKQALNQLSYNPNPKKWPLLKKVTRSGDVVIYIPSTSGPKAGQFPQVQGQSGQHSKLHASLEY